jgi:hypothetical protein
MEKKYIVKLTVGDWSHDGHGMKEDVLVKSTHKDLDKLFKKGAKKCKFDITKYCGDYDDCSISVADADIVSKTFGVELESYGDEFYLNSDTYAEIWLETCVFGDDKFDYEILEPDAKYNIGGDGLFSH